MNGQAFQAHRQLTSSDRLFGYLSSTDVTLSFQSKMDASLTFSEFYTSSQSVRADKSSVSLAAGEPSRHVQLSLSIDNVRGRVTAIPSAAQPNLKLRFENAVPLFCLHILICRGCRCQVFRGTTVVLVSTILVEICQGSTCDGVFFGSASQRIVPVHNDGAFSVSCGLSSPLNGDILMDRVQLDVMVL